MQGCDKLSGRWETFLRPVGYFPENVHIIWIRDSSLHFGFFQNDSDDENI
ncbi:hypothetical protein [Chryseobacterium sp. Leaf405]|nr:hypothetical protein [Chryseobacterium sp. Leaf405]